MIGPLARLGLIAAALAAGAVPAVSQELGTVTGRVYARASGAPFLGARVTAAGASGVALTDSAGRYLLPQVPAGSHQVAVTISGYGTVRRGTSVAPGDTSRLDFDLLPASIEPDVVLEGAAGGPVRRREVGQSVAVISGNELENSPVNTLSEALQGRLPGVLVLDASGWAGAGRQLLMRGAGSLANSDRPLGFVDGVRVADLPYPAGPGSTQAPDPLDDIDPATIDRIEVIRGPSGGSRYGREGANGVIQVFTRRGAPGRPAFSFGAAQGAEWMGHVGPGGADNPDGLGLNDCRFALGCPAGNSWLRSGHDQRYRASVTGGGGGILARYFASGTWGRENGVIAPQYGTAGSGRGNLRLQPLPHLEVAAGAAYAWRQVRWISSAFLNSVLSGSAIFDPGQNDSLFLLVNVNQETAHATGALNVTWTPVEGLEHRLTVGLDRAQSQHLADQPAGVPDPSSPATLAKEGYGLRTVTADYAGGWDVSLGGIRSGLSWGAGLRKQSLDDSTRFGSGGLFATSTSHGESTIRGLSVEERIGVRDRLFVAGGVRWDDISQWDTGLEGFPAAELSYLVSKSGFWPRWWESLQLRFAIARAGVPVRGMPIFALAPIGLPPGTSLPPLRQERSTESEVGFQSSMFGGRLELKYTHYRQHTSDVIGVVPVPPPFPFPTDVRNVGTITNRGHEALLSVGILRGRGMAWDVGAQWSTNHSSGNVVDFPVTIAGTYGGVSESMRDSVPVPSYYGFVVTNANEVGAIPVAAPGTIGPVYPTFAYGLTTRLSLGARIVLTALGEGQGGHRLPSTTAWLSTRLGVWPECFDVQDQIAVGDTAGLTAGQRARCDAGLASLAAWTLPAGFFRLRYASLMYQLPRGWPPGARRAWLGLAARNLVLLTNYPGLDPEAVTGGSTEQAFEGGVRQEWFELPHPRRVEVSVRIEW